MKGEAPDSRQVACCSTYESRVQIRDASSGGLIHEMRDGPFRMAAFSPDEILDDGGAGFEWHVYRLGMGRVVVFADS